MQDFKNAARYYQHYLAKFKWQFLWATILICISTAAIVIAPTYLGRAIEQLTTYLQL